MGLTNTVLDMKDLVELRNGERYEEILGVTADAQREDLEKALSRFIKKYRNNSEAILIGHEAYTILVDDEDRKKLVLRRWLLEKFSPWEDFMKKHMIDTILTHSIVKRFSYSDVQDFLKNKKAMANIVEMLGIGFTDVSITQDEQKEGCELHGTTGDGKTIHVIIPSRVENGEVLVIERGIIRVTVIARDAHKIFSTLIQRIAQRHNLPLDLAEKLIDRQTGIEHIRARIKQGWPDDKIINVIIDNINIPKIKPLEVKLTRDEQREGSEILLQTKQGKEIRISIPRGIGNGKTINEKGIFLTIKVIPRDAHDIFSQFAELGGYLSGSPERFRNAIDEKATLAYIRVRIKQEWTDPDIIMDLMKQVGFDVSFFKKDDKSFRDRLSGALGNIFR